MFGRKNIILIGMMGAGKTTVGRELAAALSRTFIDTDEIYISRYGSIEDTFVALGEAVFRKREGQILRELSLSSGAVIATGGGAVLSSDFSALKESGIVIYLKASIDTLYSRLSKDKSVRPLNRGREHLARIYNSREQLYERLSDLTIDTENQSVQEIIAKIDQSIRSLSLF